MEKEELIAVPYDELDEGEVKIQVCKRINGHNVGLITVIDTNENTDVDIEEIFIEMMAAIKKYEIELHELTKDFLKISDYGINGLKLFLNDEEIESLIDIARKQNKLIYTEKKSIKKENNNEKFSFDKIDKRKFQI